MKNAIEYFYNLKPINIHQSKEEYFFEVDNRNYIFQECYRTDDELYELYNLEFYLYRRNIYFHQIILNNNNEFITIVNNRRYILLSIFNNDNKKIDLKEICRLSNIKIIGKYDYIKRDNWHELWSRKIDYIETMIEENKHKYKDFSTNIDYFIGLVENAIQLLDDFRSNSLYIAHQRISTNMKIKELYNPLNIVLDSKVRDVSEYFKDTMFKKNDIDDEVFNYLKNGQLDAEDLCLFFVRFLYLTRYFDLLDNAFLTNSPEKIESEIAIITNEINRYEILLTKIYNYLFQKGIIAEIEWLKKNEF